MKRFLPSDQVYELELYGDDAAVDASAGSDVPDADDSGTDSSSYGTYGTFIRNLLGWNRTKQEELAHLQGIKYSLEHGNTADRLAAAVQLGKLDIDSAIYVINQKIATAEKEARGEMLRNVGVTVIALGGGALVLTTVGLVAVRAVVGIKQAQIAGERLKRIQSSED